MEKDGEMWRIQFKILYVREEEEKKREKRNWLCTSIVRNKPQAPINNAN